MKKKFGHLCFTVMREKLFLPSNGKLFFATSLPEQLQLQNSKYIFPSWGQQKFHQSGSGLPGVVPKDVNMFCNYTSIYGSF